MRNASLPSTMRLTLDINYLSNEFSITCSREEAQALYHRLSDLLFDEIDRGFDVIDEDQRAQLVLDLKVLFGFCMDQVKVMEFPITSLVPIALALNELGTEAQERLAVEAKARAKAA